MGWFLHIFVITNMCLLMNKITYTLILVLSFVLVATAQNKEKIKGSRIVTIEQTYVDEFSKIVIADNLPVEIVFNSKTSVEIEADDNLHEVIKFEVADGVLNFETTHQITGSKKLQITVNYSSKLEEIEVNGDAEIRSLSTLEIENLSLKTTGNSKAYLNIRTKNFNYTAADKSRSRLNVVTENAELIINDNSKIEALYTANNFKADLYQRADLAIDGTIKSAELRVDNSSNFKGKNLTIDTCTVNIEGRSTAVVNVSKSITIEATDNTEVYLYGNASITLNKFLGSAKLLKKEF